MPLRIGQLQVRIFFDRGEVFGTDVVDAVDRAGLQLDQALCAFGAPAEDDGGGDSLFAPVLFVALEDHLVAAAPLSQFVRAGAVGLLD